MSYDILTEEFGGDIQCAKVSAKKGLGIQDLLDKVLLQVNHNIQHALPSFHSLNINLLMIF